VKGFCDLADFSLKEIEKLLTKARWLEQQQSLDVLQGKVLALLFLNPSLRTLTSLQASMIRLGGGTFVISPEMSIHGLETRSGIIMGGRLHRNTQISYVSPAVARLATNCFLTGCASRDIILKEHWS